MLLFLTNHRFHTWHIIIDRRLGDDKIVLSPFHVSVSLQIGHWVFRFHFLFFVNILF